MENEPTQPDVKLEAPQAEVETTPPAYSLADVAVVEGSEADRAKRIANKKSASRPATLADISTKARCFLELMVAGKHTLEAYELAGYKGEKHAAYQLRSDLRHLLAGMLESHGISQEDVKLKLMELLRLPVHQASVDVKTKLRLLQFLDKITAEAGTSSAISPFQLNIGSATDVTISAPGEK